jgi:hypothetical protein
MDATTEHPRPGTRTRLARRGVAGVAVCALAMTLAVGTASARPSIPGAASPVTWSGNVCQALNSFQTDLKKTDQSFSNATQNSQSLTGIRAKYVAFLQTNANRTARLIAALKHAGNPKAPTGAQLAAALRAGYVDLRAGFLSLLPDARALPTDTLTNFQAAFAKVQAKIQTLQTQNSATFNGANQFESQVINDAFSKVAACKKLNSGG